MVPTVNRGSGTPLVLIPGLQGRWEYMRPTVDGLAKSFRVLTFALCGEPASGLTFDSAHGLDDYVRQVVRALDDNHIERAVICGVSFGGLIAVRFAATHPERTCALILASTPGPGWRLKRRHRVYARAPYMFGPLFLAEMPWRLRAELTATFPTRRARVQFWLSQLRTALRARVSLARMGERGRIMSAVDVVADCRSVLAPTLVVTGEPGLDYVVSVHGSSDYLLRIAGARGAVLDRTGHLGAITRPDAFSALVRDFVLEGW
jgi:pimeloyl-ACP methyl ester carboxylesterase